MSDTDPYAGPEVEEARVIEPVVPVEVVAMTEVVVPEGPAKDVLAWVGIDTTRAALALEAEKIGQKRTTLLTKLNAIIEA